MKEKGSYWWEEPLSQTEAKEKADDISAEVDDFKEALENHIEGCDVEKVKTEHDKFEEEELQNHQALHLDNYVKTDLIAFRSSFYS